MPEKIVKFTSEDQVWATPEIKEISRKKSREYFKHRKSLKWRHLNSLLEEKCQIAREAYYINIVSDLKNSNPGQWYSKLKRMTSYDNLKSEEVTVENICHLPDIEQAEIIADNFSRISNSYNPIDPDKICTSQGNEKSTPKVEAFQVYEFLKKIKTNTNSQRRHTCQTDKRICP